MSEPQEIPCERSAAAAPKATAAPHSPSSIASPSVDARRENFDGGATKQRRSSTASSDTAESGEAPVVPLAASTPHVPRLELEKLGGTAKSATAAANSLKAAAPAPSASVKAPSSLPPTKSLSAPQSTVFHTFSFEEVMSPRQQNGKRYLGGYLQHRVAMAGGFLKTWKRKYFRLRDHGVVCYKNAEDSLPLFEVVFTAASVLMLGKQHADSVTNSPSSAPSSDKYAVEEPKSKAAGPLLLVLKHVEVVGHQTPAAKVEVPLYLKADSLADYTNWSDGLRLKLEARKRALAQSSVDAAVSGSSSSRRDSLVVDDRSALVGGAADAANAPTGGKTSGTNDAPSANTDTRASESQQQQQAVDPPEYALFQNKYMIMREVGEGSFSIVHKAVNRLTGCLCAVKCCKASAALEEEVGIMRKLSHPNIVGVEAVYTQDNMCFVVMDFMEDGDLCDRLIQRQKLPESEAQVIVSQVLQGLEYLHRHHILHRDIKPENILLHGDAVKIADFGLAKQLPNASAMLKRSCGTLEYAAPELLIGQPYGLKSDIFSLGVVLYVLLFGAFPFSIESAAALQSMERFPEGVDVRDMSCLSPENAQWRSVSRQAQDVILKMLTPRESERVSAKELLVHPWFDPDRTSSLPSLGAIINPSRRRDSTTWRMHELNAAGQECVRLADCEMKGFRELLGCGLELTKFSNKGSAAPHLSSISIDFALAALQWTARHGLGSARKANDAASANKQKRGRSILLRDIQEIRVGHSTETFIQAAKGKDPPSPDVCMSIVCPWRTLDLVVKAPRQREFLVKGLTRLVHGASGSGGLEEQLAARGKPGLEHFKV